MLNFFILNTELTLSYQDNGIETLDGLPSLPRLTHLLLAGNKLATVSASVFVTAQVCHTMLWLVLSSNAQLQCLDGVTALSHLQRLVLDDCVALTLPALSALQPLTALQTLSLNHVAASAEPTDRATVRARFLSHITDVSWG